MNPEFTRHQKLPGFDLQSPAAMPGSERRSLDRLDAGITSKLAGREVSAPVSRAESTFLPQFEGTQQAESSRT